MEKAIKESWVGEMAKAIPIETTGENNMKRFILILALCSPIIAQDSLDYYYEGRIAAESEYSPVLAIAGGITAGTLGVLTGWVIGTFIIYIVEPNVPAHHLRGMSSYQRRDFQDGYKAAVKKMRAIGYHGGAAVGIILGVKLWMPYFL